MKRLFAIAVALYLPHLAEEALTGMHDDPLIAAAYAPLAALGPRHAAYLVFQVTFALGLVTTLLFARGGVARRVVVALFGIAMLAEAHHVLRAVCTLSWDSGLVTSLPLPFVGTLLLGRALTRLRKTSCSTPSSSPWASAASSSGSRRSSRPVRARASSDSPRATTTPPLA